MVPRSDINKPFFNSLQVFRGIAALMVVLFHQWGPFVHFYKVHNYIIGFLTSLGQYGVEFFFVLSGFIITYSNYEKAGKIADSRTYMINRILRIYIPFLPVSILMLLLYFMFPSISEGPVREISLLTSLTLIPHGKPALTVAWTLTHEMMFYLLFLSWFFSKRLWYWVVIIWTLCIIIFNYYSSGLATSSPFLNYFGSYYNLEFIMGFLAAIILKYRGIRDRKVYLFSGITILLIAVLLNWIERADTLINPGISLFIALGFGCIILANIGSRLDNKSSRSLWMIIGNASYSIYLVHKLVISTMSRAVLKLDAYIPSFVIFIIIFLLCCIAGVIYSKIFEVHFLKIFKKKLLPEKKLKPELSIKQPL